MAVHSPVMQRISILVWICLSMMRVSCIHILKEGDSLNSSSQLDSPNGRFTLRFYNPRPQQTNATYIAILFNPPYDNPPYQTPVLWIGNRDNPIIPTTYSTPLLTLTPLAQLIITRHNLDPHPILLSSPSHRTTNVTATLSDTGNLLIQDMTMNSSSSIILWQSFDHPTDTLLPGMKLGTITSWLSQTNPASGAFTLEWDQASGEIVIRRRGTAYWRSGRLHDYHNYGVGNVKSFENFITDPDPLNFNFNLTNEGDYFVYRVIPVQKWTPDKFKVSSGWRLDWSGNLTLTDERGLVMAMATVCDGFTTEGPSMYSMGCQLWGQPHCRNRLQTFVRRSGIFVHANGRDAYTPSLSNRSLNLSLSDCRDECWTNCECVGYSTLLGRDYGCSYWIGRDLVWDQDNEGLSEVKYVLQSSREGKKRYVGIILGVVTSVGVVLMLGLAYLIMRSRKLRREEQLQQLLTLEGYELESRGANSHHLKLFSYASVLAATNSFSSNNKLGEGGFGPVYKGVTAEGEDIAVKLLSRQSGQGLLEFKNELILICELQHVNLVKLLGFCIHKDDKMIIYDYMPNKSLDCFLFSPSKREQLDWKKRFNIIEGTAQGLLYLHKHSRLRIIHRDMKPNNILLDENMTPKISDFGLARIFKEDSSEVNTNKRVGTYGYMAPEYAMQGIFSVKSDVYSFGVLLLEIVSGRRNNSFHDIQGPLSIVEYAWELWRKDCAVELMDPMLRDPCIIDQLQRCIQIGLLCVENQAVDRPTIEYVLLMLKNETITLPTPTNPACITRNTSILQQVEKKTSTKSNEDNFSANQVTLSEINGR